MRRAPPEPLNRYQSILSAFLAFFLAFLVRSTCSVFFEANFANVRIAHNMQAAIRPYARPYLWVIER